ncbi:MAG TPA: GAF domain-containing protein [Anaerolineales bacterium]|nr:GAF domain-containing protein [Anaerolineales bacterium]
MSFPNLSLRLKVIVALAGITVLTVAVLASYLLNRIYQNAYNSAAAQITSVNQEHILSIQTFLSEHSQDVMILSRLPDLHNLIVARQTGASPAVVAADNAAFTQDLQAFFEAHPVYDNLRFIDGSGQEVAKVTASYISATLQNKASRPFFSIPSKMPAGTLYLSPLELEQDMGKIIVPNVPVVRFATPVYYNNKLAGVVVANIVAKNFLNVLNDPSHHVILVDQKGFYLYDNQGSSRLFGGATDLNTGYTILKDMPTEVSSLLSGKAGSFSDQNNVYFYAPVTILNGTAPSWLLIYEIPRSEIYASANQALSTSLLILMAILLVAIALAVYLGNSMIAPLTHLTQAAREAAEGKLFTPTGITSNDEIGVLARAFNLMTRQLSEQIRTLDQHVAERTADLERSNQANQERVRELQIVADVAQAVASVRSLDSLLPKVVQIISERFGYYHTGIFLLDDQREYAVLRAASSEGGKRMLAREHKLRAEASSIVGYVASTGKPRVTSDVGSDAIYFTNPDLPATHAEMAVPLAVGNQLIGVLDIQSAEPSAFGKEQIEVLVILANQVAVAIENARSFGEANRALANAQQVYNEFVAQRWDQYAKAQTVFGYRFEKGKVSSLATPLHIQSPAPAADSDDRDLVLPIQIRNKTIGVINIRATDSSHGWSEDELAVVRAMADRVALALESARLLEDSLKRADKERVIGEISARIGSSTSVDSIVRLATQELGRIMAGSEITLQLEPPKMTDNR